MGTAFVAKGTISHFCTKMELGEVISRSNCCLFNSKSNRGADHTFHPGNSNSVNGKFASFSYVVEIHARYADSPFDPIVGKPSDSLDSQTRQTAQD